MKIDFAKFRGTLPYASEMFGIYQPLLGWKSKMNENRMARGQEALIRSLSERAIARTRSDVAVVAGTAGFKVTNLQIQNVVDTTVTPRVSVEINSVIARIIANRLPIDRTPTPKEWRAALDKVALDSDLRTVKDVIDTVFAQKQLSAGLAALQVESYIDDAITEGRRRDRPVAEMLKGLLDREVSIATYLNRLATQTPAILDTLFYRRVSDPFDDLLTLTTDPLASLGHNGLEAALSPIGLVHLFRQYFFEFDTFLGPPVGHVWLSPGSTLELVEETVRRTLTERTVESTTETTDKEEKDVAVHDELSSAIKEENRNELKFGFGASVNYHNGTLDAGAHTDLSLDNSRTAARETAHKQMREQSEKLSSEIRRSFKSTFRTVVETTSTSSRRYVLQNTTKELINYELRRKMRQVGVQVQDIGTQLCWQVFVDDPGRDLGVARLLHIAQPPDLASLHAPEAPAKLEPKTVDLSVQFPYMRDPTSEGDGETDVLYIEGDDQEHIGGVHNVGYNDKIYNVKTFALTPPASGYTLANQFAIQHHHSGTVDAEATRADDHSVTITLHQVNFKDQPFVELQLTTTWTPDPAQQAAIDAAHSAALATYDAEKSKLERQAFLSAARERIKQASQIRKRPFEDLREEERIVVYRNLIGQLMSVGDQLSQDVHVTAELIRAIFDVDEMLYFVAPEWWRSRNRPAAHHLSAAPTPGIITDHELVGWDGPLSVGRDSNYLITDESDPAPMGSSLGWLLELDGDALRNAFLNSPWVRAIIPIRPGKEEAAINWLTLAHVAGTSGLDARYDAPAAELKKINAGLLALGRVPHVPVTLQDALLYLADQVQKEYKAATTAKPSPFDANKNVIPTETVYEHGFDPLAGGFEVNVDPTKVFSQWIEVLATDQVAAVPYNAEDHL